MAKLYYNLIKNGKWTLDKVPQRWYEEVKALLDENK